MGITLHHLVGRLKASVGDFGNRKLLMVGLLSRNNWSISSQREVDTWVGHQVGLELCQVHIESSVKPKRSCNGRHNLADQAVQVGVAWPLNVEITLAKVYFYPRWHLSFYFPIKKLIIMLP